MINVKKTRRFNSQRLAGDSSARVSRSGVIGVLCPMCRRTLGPSSVMAKRIATKQPDAEVDGDTDGTVGTDDEGDTGDAAADAGETADAARSAPPPRPTSFESEGHRLVYEKKVRALEKEKTKAKEAASKASKAG